MNPEIIPPDHPHFFQPLLAGFRRKLKIPVNFMKTHLNDEVLSKKKRACESSNATLSVLLRSHNREWVVRLHGRCLGKGWPKFINGYYCNDDDSKKMDVGDILVFRHIGNLVFDVSVFHPITGIQKLPNHHSNIDNDHRTVKRMKIPTTATTDHVRRDKSQSHLMNSRKKMKMKKKKKIENMISPKKKKKREQFNCSQSQPYFDSVISMNIIRKKSMYVPIAFVKEAGLERSCEMILKDDRGRRWEVYARFYYRGYSYFTKGWNEFHVGNDLKLKDCIRFGLVKNGQRPVILVTKLIGDDEEEEEEEGEEPS